MMEKSSVFSQRMKTLLWAGAIALFAGIAPIQSALGGAVQEMESLIGSGDALMVVDPTGKVMVQKNADRALVPASILKIFTSLVAIHHLGPDYRFATDFYLDDRNNLTIKGYGDPLLISETVAEIASTLAKKTPRLNDIILDDSHFSQPLEIPGISSSSRPSDAPNGALCVNFNTVFFKKENGSFVSAEPQTPLLPIALDRVRSSGLSQGRIVLCHDENRVTLYAGRLFEHFLRRAGVDISGDVCLGTVQVGTDRLVHRHFSAFTLRDIIAKLLDHSNNFITNQILIAAGINASGPPGTLDKGVAAAQAFGRTILELEHTQIIEGSGISRKNRMSASDMAKVLEAFAPHYTLLRNERRLYCKRGILRGISTRAGYVKNRSGELHRFVVMINSSSKSAEQVTRRLLAWLQ